MEPSKRELLSQPEKGNETDQATQAILEFIQKMPKRLTDELLGEVFDQLDNIPGSGGPDLIYGIAKRIIEAYQTKYQV